MATPGEMIVTVATALRRSEVMVGAYYRAVREAGLIRTGGRGRSAMHVQPVDVARLLIAMMCSDVVRDVPEAVTVFGDLRFASSWADAAMGKERPPYPNAERFEDALIDMFMMLAPAAGRTQPTADEVERFGVSVSVSERCATLNSDQASASFISYQAGANEPDENGLGLRVHRAVSGPALMLMATLVDASAIDTGGTHLAEPESR